LEEDDVEGDAEFDDDFEAHTGGGDGDDVPE